MEPEKKDGLKEMRSRAISVGITEYTQVFGALRDRLNYFAQFFQFYFAGLLAAYGAAAISKKYEIVFLLPILALPPFWKIIWDQLMVKKINEYIRMKLTNQIHKIALGENEEYSSIIPMSWERDWGPNADGPKYYKHALFSLFFINSCLPAILLGIYNILSLNEIISTTPVSCISDQSIRAAIIFNAIGLITSVSIGIYMSLIILKREF